MKILSVLKIAALSVLISAGTAQAQCIPNPFPANWLQQQEALGGHTIARHVGRTDAQLVARLNANPGIAQASTYTDEATAETVITLGLAIVRNAANAWAAGANNGARRVDNFVANINVGRVAFRPPALGNIVNSMYFRTVLNADGAGGCILLTSYPTLPPAAAASAEATTTSVKDGQKVPDELSALAGYLAGQFADSDLAGETDEQAATSGLTSATKKAYQDSYNEGVAFLGSQSSDWSLIGDWANRSFSDSNAAKSWLANVMAWLDAGLKKTR